jgi:hypothetical protein
VVFDSAGTALPANAKLKAREKRIENRDCFILF